MARYRPRDFTHEYARLRDRINREYGERGYNDKFKIETSGTLKQEEPDYSMHFKPYKPQMQHNETPSWENTERLEPKGVEPPQKVQTPNQMEIQEQLDAYKSQLQSKESVDKLLEKTETSPIENDLLESEQPHRFEELEPNETPDDFISDEDIMRQEKLRKLQGQPRSDY